MHDTEATVRLFVEQINAQDLMGLAMLLTEDHLFVDAEGGVVQGRAEVTQGWQQYFEWMPDYAIDIETLMVDGERAAVFGRAGGTVAVEGDLLPENRWNLPAAWQVVVRDGKIAQWRVYCDTRAVYDIMDRRR